MAPGCFRYELGILLTIVQILSLGDTIPPATLGLVMGQTLLYMNIVRKPWTKFDICISANSVLYNYDYKRLVLSALEHGDDMHLYYNMASLILKGRNLEKIYGVTKYLCLMLFLTVFTSLYYVLLSYAMFLIHNDDRELAQCAIGFSAVLFAMKTILTRVSPEGVQQVLNINVKAHYAPWIELFIIHLMIPNASFKGHLSGILVGLTYADTPIGRMLDQAIYKLETTIHGENGDDQDPNEAFGDFVN